MLVVIKGAGDLASGVALRLVRAGFSVVMTDLPKPTSIRRTICFSEALVKGETTVEGIVARRAEDAAQAEEILKRGEIPVLPDPEAKIIQALNPPVVVDGILAKKNLGTRIQDAPAVIALGPGFTAGKDCHAVVETMRGHMLGRVYYEGSAIPNTGIPGNIDGFTIERLIRAPKAGIFTPLCQIGDQVEAGQVVARVDDEPVLAGISGVLRGILPDGTEVFEGMKSGDVDPRCKPEYCHLVSDKALAIAGGVLEAIGHCLKGEAVWSRM